MKVIRKQADGYTWTVSGIRNGQVRMSQIAHAKTWKVCETNAEAETLLAQCNEASKLGGFYIDTL